MQLPGSEKSYNPSPEFFDEKIEPQTSLRNLQANDEIIRDQFERMMDLYLAPRVRKKRIHMRPEDLI